MASCDRALALQPDSANAFSNRGTALYGLKRFDEALASYDRALALQPDDVTTLSMRGFTLHEMRRFDEALASYDRALALQPNDADVLNNRGLALDKLKRHDEALASCSRAIGLRPHFYTAFNSRGTILYDLRRYDEALADYERAIALRPDFAEAHWNEALVKLITGDFERGWAKYEWRWNKESWVKARRNFPQPLWLGGTAIDGKAILLHSEQGLGDTIQFCRYAPMVAARGARVILEVEKSLRELMTTVAGVAQVISKGDPLPDFDVHCPLLSLPLAFGTQLETIPSGRPYLRAPSANSASWEMRLGPKRPRIGLVWSGNAVHQNDRDRSISLRSLLPLLDIDATFVSLQKDVRAADAATLAEHGRIIQLGDALKDFSDTAAAISQLDLFISVDTSVAHLAGALGMPVWVLLAAAPDWRWLLDWDTSPWYPTARLFRQDDRRTWDSVVPQVREAALKFVGSRD